MLMSRPPSGTNKSRRFSLRRPFDFFMRLHPFFGVLLALLAGTMWATNAIFVKLIPEMTAFGIAAGRMFFAFLILLAGIVIAGRWGEIVASAKRWRFWLIISFLISLHWLPAMEAYRTTLAANAQMFNNTTALFLLFLGPFFLKELLTRRDVVLALVTFSGMGLMMAGRGFSFDPAYLRGDFFAILAALLFSFYTIYVRRHHAKAPFYVMMFWLFGVGGLWMLVESWVFGMPLFLAPMAKASWGFLAVMALMGTAIGHSAYYVSLQELRADQTSLIALIGPPFAAVLAYFILGEALAWQTVVGLGITLLGIAGIIRSHVRAVKNGA